MIPTPLGIDFIVFLSPSVRFCVAPMLDALIAPKATSCRRKLHLKKSRILHGDSGRGAEPSLASTSNIDGRHRGNRLWGIDAVDCHNIVHLLKVGRASRIIGSDR
jgi:hypothetical protein